MKTGGVIHGHNPNRTGAPLCRKRSGKRSRVAWVLECITCERCKALIKRRPSLRAAITAARQLGLFEDGGRAA